jgi:hypothetical protein
MNILTWLFKDEPIAADAAKHDRRQADLAHQEERRRGERRDVSEFGNICRKQTEEDLKTVATKLQQHLPL